MEMTKRERVALINQYEILSILKPDQADHYKQLIEVLSSGYKLFYNMIDEWISDEIDEGESRFVLDILGLYRAIEDVKRNYQDNQEIQSERLSYFRGFDGNNEGSFLSFTRFLIEEQGKFAEQKPYFVKNDHLNSHTEMVPTYKKMLRAWKKIGGSYQLSESQVLAILKSED